MSVKGARVDSRVTDRLDEVERRQKRAEGILLEVQGDVRKVLKLVGALMTELGKKGKSPLEAALDTVVGQPASAERVVAEDWERRVDALDDDSGNGHDEGPE